LPHCLQLPGLSLLAEQLLLPGDLPQVRTGAPHFTPEPLGLGGPGEIVNVCHRLPALFPLELLKRAAAANKEAYVFGWLVARVGVLLKESRGYITASHNHFAETDSWLG